VAEPGEVSRQILTLGVSHVDPGQSDGGDPGDPEVGIERTADQFGRGVQVLSMEGTGSSRDSVGCASPSRPPFTNFPIRVCSATTSALPGFAVSVSRLRGLAHYASIRPRVSCAEESMSEVQVRGISLYFEERGTGVPILCIHGLAGTASGWTTYVEELARIGRVIIYDRRGCHRSERPVPYLTTTIGEHAEDASALLQSLAAAPAVVIGRSLGGEIALDLAVRHPEQVRALVLLDPAILTLDPEAEIWGRTLQQRLHEVLDREGMDAAAQAVFRLILGDGVWMSLPAPLRATLVANGPAMMAELDGDWLRRELATLARVEQACLLVASEDSPPAFRRTVERLAPMLPNAREIRVAGSHLISPLEPRVLSFLHQVAVPAAS